MNVKMESFRNETKLVETNYQKFLLQPLKTKDSSLTQSCLDRLNAFYTENNEFESDDIVYRKFPELKSDSVLLIASMEYYATINSKKYKSLKEVNLKFPEFFIINQADIDSLKNFKIQIESLQNNKSKYENSNLTTADISNILYPLSIWLLAVLFGLRYTLYSTKWAILTIKSKE